MRQPAAVLLAALVCAGGLGAQERREESVGVVPITAETRTPRDDALRAAVQAAVVRTARALLPDGGAALDGARPGEVDEGAADVRLAERLGDPFGFATRYRVIEDRGPRPAMFSADPAVENEYVVMAEVTLDEGAIRDRLVGLGLLASHAAGGGSRSVMLTIEGLDGYRPFALLRRALLDDAKVSAARPVEFGGGRAVLAVDGDRDAPGLVAELQRRAPQGLEIVPLSQSSGAATLRVLWTPPAPAEPGPGVEPDPAEAGSGASPERPD